MTTVAPVKRLRAGRVLALAAGLVIVSLLSATPVAASPSVQFGIQDDAWLLHGPGTLDARMTELERLGVDIVRITLRWNEIARHRPADPRDQLDPAYGWSDADRLLRALRRHDIAAVVTLVGTPRWANGGRSSNWAPTDARSFGNFAYAAASRYPWVRAWTIWNEPNQTRWLQPTSTSVYVKRLLNPAYAQIHAVTPGARVGGGMTSPRANRGVSPVAWIREMGRLGARLDAYAHHPYPSQPKLESPWEGGCEHCSTLSMAGLERLLDEVRRSLGPTRVWLTEYGYQTDPPDAILGVPPETQARYVASAARRVYLAADVDMLIYFLIRDDAETEGWQSGLVTDDGVQKPSYTAFRLPLEQVARTTDRVTLWGQIRPRSGIQPYRLRVVRDGRWSWLGDTRWTDTGGFFSVTVGAKRGSLVKVFSPRDRSYGLPLRIR
jgi:hypothetical protein